jgi:hypothetical protein
MKNYAIYHLKMHILINLKASVLWTRDWGVLTFGRWKRMRAGGVQDRWTRPVTLQCFIWWEAVRFHLPWCSLTSNMHGQSYAMTKALTSSQAHRAGDERRKKLHDFFPGVKQNEHQAPESTLVPVHCMYQQNKSYLKPQERKEPISIWFTFHFPWWHFQAVISSHPSVAERIKFSTSNTFSTRLDLH